MSAFPVFSMHSRSSVTASIENAILKRFRLGGGTGRRTGLKIRSPARGVGVRFPSQAWKQRNLTHGKVTSGGLLTFGASSTARTSTHRSHNPPRSSGVVRSAGKFWNHAHRYAARIKGGLISANVSQDKKSVSC